MATHQTNLHELRVNRGLTRVALAQAAGITERQLARYEDGKSPPLTVGFSLADALGVHVLALVDD